MISQRRGDKNNKNEDTTEEHIGLKILIKQQGYGKITVSIKETLGTH